MPKKKRRLERPNMPPGSRPVESRPAEAITVAWMLSVMTTLMCAGMAGMVWLFLHDHSGNETAMLLVGYLHFSSFVTAIVSLALLGPVLKMRRAAPPLSIVALAVIAAALPILAAFF